MKTCVLASVTANVNLIYGFAVTTGQATALRIIEVSFFALAAYVTVESMQSFVGTEPATHSLTGIVLAAISLALMRLLSGARRRAGRELGSR